MENMEQVRTSLSLHTTLPQAFEDSKHVPVRYVISRDLLL